MLAAAALPALTSGAKAQVVYCTNCSTVWDNATSLANQATSLGNEAKSLANDITKITNQVTQITNQITQIQNEVHMIERLPGSVFANHQLNLNALTSVVNQGTMLSGQINTTLTRLQNGTYPTTNLAGPQAQLNQTRTQMGSNYQNLQTMLTAQMNQVNTDVGLLTQLTSRAQSTTGQHSGINVQNEYNSQIAGQLMKIHQTLIALTQALTTQAAANHDRQGLIDQKKTALVGTALCANCSQF